MVRQGLPDEVRYTSNMMCGISGEDGYADACRGDSGGAITREVSFNLFSDHVMFSYLTNKHFLVFYIIFTATY